MKKLILRILASDLLWPAILRVGQLASSSTISERIFQRILYERILLKRSWIEAFVGEHLPDLAVTHGPFSGLAYPTLESTGSMLVPKLLGTYESEISSAFDAKRFAQYDTVVDIGCAEGFYAVGTARLNSQCQVYAYDIFEHAQMLCRALAEFNGVADRVHVAGTCALTDLLSHRAGPTLIISDCEGAEMDLLAESVVSELVDADFVIEVHEHLGADLETLVKRFEPTHDCRVIPGLMDLQRMKTYRHVAVDPLPDHEQILLYAECRTRGNCWLIARSQTRRSVTERFEL